MKKVRAIAGIMILLILTMILMTACETTVAPTTSASTEAGMVETAVDVNGNAPTTAAATEAIDSGTPSAADMEHAVHNSFSDSFCKTINESDLFTMEMYAEGTVLVWELTFKKDLTDSEKEAYKKKLIESDLTENLTTVRGAVQKDVSSTNFTMTVRYYTKDGELLLEQKSK